MPIVRRRLPLKELPRTHNLVPFVGVIHKKAELHFFMTDRLTHVLARDGEADFSVFCIRGRGSDTC